MQGVGQRLEQILRSLEEMVPDVEAVVVINDEGLVLASSVPLGLDEDRIAAMATVALSLSERTMRELDRGNWDHVIISGEKGMLVVYALSGSPGAIAVLASREAKTGMILYLLRKIGVEIVNVLEGREETGASGIEGADVNLPPL